MYFVFEMFLALLLLLRSSSRVLKGSVNKEFSSDSSIELLLGSPFLPTDDSQESLLDGRYQCYEEEEEAASRDYKFRGTSLGGWMVLEPWITPSLFYQFLGANERFGQSKGHVAFDSYSFCEVLGQKEANRQLRIHWQNWVTEEQIRNLSALGLNSIRIPIADWMYIPYYPFDSGCWEGSLAEVDRVLDLCQKYGLEVLLDLHAVRGSQNGLDNSGDVRHYEWISNTTFRHWDIRGGDWAGNYDPIARAYITVNETQILNTLSVILVIAQRYAHHPAVIGLQPINEPWDMIPWEIIREFYWRSYRLIRRLAPHWIVLFHDSFRLGTASDSVWLKAIDTSSTTTTQNHRLPSHSSSSLSSSSARRSRFLAGCKHFLVDIHIYQAWAWDPYDSDSFLHTTCAFHQRFRELTQAGVGIVVGEWSLAMDNCAMWLNGLNDNVPGYPKVTCARIDCRPPYFPQPPQTIANANTTPSASSAILPDKRIPNAPPNKKKGREDPYGMGGNSYVEFGTCPVDHTQGISDFTASMPSRYNVTAVLHRIGMSAADWRHYRLQQKRSTVDGEEKESTIDEVTEEEEEDEDENRVRIEALLAKYRRNKLAAFAAAQWSAFNRYTQGQFFWNFRTELEDAWDIQRAASVDLQLLPFNMSLDSSEAEDMITWGCFAYIPWQTQNDYPQPPWFPVSSRAEVVFLYLMVSLACVSGIVAAVFCAGRNKWNKRFRSSSQQDAHGYEPIDTNDNNNNNNNGNSNGYSHYIHRTGNNYDDSNNVSRWWSRLVSFVAGLWNNNSQMNSTATPSHSEETINVDPSMTVYVQPAWYSSHLHKGDAFSDTQSVRRMPVEECKDSRGNVALDGRSSRGGRIEMMPSTSSMVDDTINIRQSYQQS